MCVKLSLGDCPCPLHPTSTYTCEVTIAPKVIGGFTLHFEMFISSSNAINKPL